MPWTNQGGGGPWGSGGGKGPWGSGPQSSGPTPPDLEEMLRRGQDKLRGFLPGGNMGGRGFALLLLAALALWGFSGFFRVGADEIGVVLRFGQAVREVQPGLNYHLPYPVESVLTPKALRINKIDIGMREIDNGRGGASSRNVPEESLMLTGDENIVDVNFTVFWLVKDAPYYLFNIRDPEMTVKAAAESSMREVIGHTQIASALAEGRAKIENDTQKLLQEILDAYGSGVQITQVQLQKVDPPGPVIDSFRDVQSAKIDQQTLINQAQAYANSVVPQAHGDASRAVLEAQAYKAQVVLQAQGDAARFDSVYQSYKASQDVTARRLYIETIESVLKNTKKILIDKSVSQSGVVPYLPLPGLSAPAPSAAPKAPAAPAAQAPSRGGSR
ncbi:MAG: FtsH protease activity modulator HflK [Stellaceae bacterium]